MNTRKSITEDLSVYGRIPPQAVDVEECLLGALILEHEAFDQVAGLVTEMAFYKEEHRIIFNVVAELHKEQKMVDLMMVTNRLRENSTLEQVGGALYVTKLVNKAPYAAHIEQYARIMVDKYVKRDIILKCSEMMNMAYDETIDLEELIYTFQKSGTELDKHFESIDDGFSTLEVAKSTLEGIYFDVEKYRKNIPPGIDTGFIEYNRMTGGFRASTLNILAARPSMGKTSVAIKHIMTAALKSEWVNFFSFEMTKEQIFRIIISGEGEIDRTNVRDGKLSDEELKKVNSTIGRIEKLPIIWYTNPMNIHNIKRRVRRNYKKGKCSIVFIDYLQLILASDPKMIREQQIAEISRELKNLSKELEIPVIALSQLNRLAETEVPQLRHLRESGSLEADADVVVMLYKELDNDMNELSYRMIIAKARNGEIGMFEVWHNKQYTQFGNKGSGEFYPEPNFNYNPNQQFEPRNGDEPF
jgi:replicative DNA helicase